MVAGLLILSILSIGRPSVHFSSNSDEKNEVRIAYFPNLTHAAALYGMATGQFQRALPGWKVRSVVVNAGPGAIEALLAGAVDFAYVGPSPAINAYLRTKGRALSIVAAACSGGVSLISRKGVEIRSLRDLDGKRVAIPHLGGTQDVSLRHFISAVGLKPKENGGTVEILPIKNPDLQALFKSGDLDAAWIPEPWASKIVQERFATSAIQERDLWPNRRFASTVLVVRKSFAMEHPREVERVFEAHLKSVRAINANRIAAARIVNLQLKNLTGKALSRDVLYLALSHLDFDEHVDLPNLVAFSKAARDAGYQKGNSIPIDGILIRPNLVAKQEDRRLQGMLRR